MKNTYFEIAKLFFIIILLLGLPVFSQVITVNGILLPSGGNATQATADQLQIGGPASDFATTQFRFPFVNETCSPHFDRRTVEGQINTTGKTLLIVVSPSDCPSCRIAANAANAPIMARLNDIVIWYVVKKLNSDGDCAEMNFMKGEYPFLNAASHSFIDSWWWDNSLGRAHHGNQGQSSYWTMPEMPSVYRVVDPVTKKVTSLGYFLDVVGLDVAISHNYNPNASLSANPTSLNYVASGATSNITIAGTGAWTVSDNAAWLTLSTASGSGTKIITATAANNTTINTRNATISVVGTSSSTSVSVTQNGASPILTTHTNTLNFVDAGQTLPVSVTSNISWTTADNAAWITLNAATGTGNGVLNITAGANPTTIARSASATISGNGIDRVVSITQNAAAAALQVLPTSLSYSDIGNTQNISVTGNITWTTSDDGSWLSLSVSSGSNNSVFTATATNNASITARNAIISVLGGVFVRTISVSQAGATPLLVANPSNFNYASVASSNTITVSSNFNWNIQDDATWLSLGVANGTGNGFVSALATENLSVASRSATITISGGAITRIITISQAGANPVLSSNSNTINYISVGGTENIAITSNISWTISNNAAWLSVNSISGSGNANITATAASNTSILARNTTISIAGGALLQIINITQAGANPILNVSPSSLTYVAAGGVYPISITSNFGWATTDDATWLSLSTATGNGTTNITATATANGGVIPRVASITISGGNLKQIISVVQNASSAVLTVNPTNMHYAAAGASQAITISTNASWLATSSGSWLSVSATNGSGNASINAIATTNTSTSARSANIVVSVVGSVQSISVNQAGATPVLGISPNTYIIAATGGTQAITITCNTSWQISSDQSWLTANSVSGTGKGIVNAVVAPNNTINKLTGNLTFSYPTGQTTQFNVTVLGAAPILTVSNTTLNYAAAASTQNVNITSNTTWTVAKSDAWINIASANGNGNNAAYQISVIANPTTITRTGSVTFSGANLVRIVTIDQTGIIPILTASPSTINQIAAAQNTTLSITSNINWAINSAQSWLSFSTNAGNGSADISVISQSNTTLLPRIGLISITGATITQVVTITQAGMVANLTVSTTQLNFGAAEQSMTLSINSNIVWTLTKSDNWITANDISGNGNVSNLITASINTNAVSRSGFITVSGANIVQIITVNQAGTAPLLSANPTQLSYFANASSQNIQIVSNTTWTVSPSDSWISIHVNAGNGNSALSISVIENLTTNTKNGFITISGSNIHIIIPILQAAANAVLEVATQINLTSASGMQSISVSGNVQWAAISSTNWISLGNQTGTGNGSFTINYTSNPTVNTRQSQLTLTGGNSTKLVSISQNGASPSLQFLQTALQVPATVSIQNISIAGTSNWILNTVLHPWIQVSNTNGTGNSVVTITTTSNPRALPRTGQINLNGAGSAQVLTITQAGVIEQMTVNNATLVFGKAESSEVLNITSNTNWAILGAPNWIISDPLNGSDSNPLIITSLENTSNQTRTATITLSGFAGKKITISVSQAGNTTSVFENSTENTAITLLPNPAPQNSIVQLFKVADVQVVDVYGKLHQAANQTSQINVSSLHPGIYFIIIKSHKTIKLIVE